MVITRISKEDAEKRLADVPEQYNFWCRDGRILKNMRDLEQALTTMSDETYAYHVNEGKNDFSNWIRDIVGDAKLSRDLGKASSRMQATKKVSERIGFYTNKLV